MTDENTETTTDGGMDTQTTSTSGEGDALQQATETMQNLGDDSNWLYSEPVDTVVPPAFAGLSTFLTWVVVNIPIIGSKSMMGLDTDIGLLVLLSAVVVLGLSVWKSGEYGGVARYVGGGLIVALGLLRIWANGAAKQRLVSQAANSGNPFAEGMASAVSINTGIGVWLAILAGAVMVYVEYNRRQSDELVAEDEFRVREELRERI